MTANRPISKQAIYSKVASRIDGVIDRLFELAESKNDSVALGACKTLINKVLPDDKRLEFDEIRQLRTMHDILGSDPDWLDKLYPPTPLEIKAQASPDGANQASL